MSYHKFKVGDRVRVTRAFTIEEFPKPGWALPMASSVGKVCEIMKVFPYRECIVYGLAGAGGYTWPEEVLELVVDPDEAAVRLEAEAIIRDAMRYRAIRSGRTYGSGTQVYCFNLPYDTDSRKLLTGMQLDAVADELAEIKLEVHPEESDLKGVLNETPVAAPAAFRSAGS